MEYEQVIFGLDALSAKGMDFGVERTRAILDKLGSPDKKLKIIHIAGTNGKGSVAEYFTRILICASKRVGTFTSPAVYDYSEQFRINGEPVKRALFAEAFGKALKCADGATRFEVETAGALYAFALTGCEYAVVECGLGGRYDATNAISTKEIAVITSISLEHTSILGDTLASICGHKSGIIKNCPVVISAYNPPEVLDYFKRFGAVVAGKYENPPLKGEAQQYNSGVAAEGARLLGIDENAIYSGVNGANLGGRIEIIEKGNDTYILDGAHNPSAVSELSAFIEKEFGYADSAVVGSLSDKDIRANITEIKRFAKKIVAVKPESNRAMRIENILEACEEQGVLSESAPSVADALCKLKGITVVCGTFTILKEAKLWIEKRQ